MTTNLSDSDPEGVGTLGAPTPSGSAKEGDKPGSGQGTAATEQPELLSRLERLERQIQSEKDRAVKKTNERMDKLEGDLRAVLERAAQEGKSAKDMVAELDQQDEAEFRASVKELAQAIRGGKLPATPVGNGGPGAEVTKIIQELELDASDAGVNKAVAEYGKDPVKLAVELGKYKVSQATQTPSPLAAPALGGGAASGSGPATSELIAELNGLYKMPTGNDQRIKELEKELEKRKWK